MKEFIVKYVNYNLWANKRVIEILMNLSVELWDKELGGSFGSLHKTTAHICNAEMVWLQRLIGHVPQVSNIQGKALDKNIVCERWIKSSNEMIQYVLEYCNNVNLSEVITYTNLKGIECSNRRVDAILHCMNHSTFHRGQLINYLRMIQIIDIPSTDYIQYCREL